MTSAFFNLLPTSNRLFNNCVKLYYYIRFFLKYQREVKLRPPPTPPPPEKPTKPPLKSPALLGLKKSYRGLLKL